MGPQLATLPPLGLTLMKVTFLLSPGLTMTQRLLLRLKSNRTTLVWESLASLVRTLQLPKLIEQQEGAVALRVRLKEEVCPVGLALSPPSSGTTAISLQLRA